MHVGITGFGTWLPPGRVTAADLAAATGIPESVIALKFGVKGKPVAGPGETTAFMGLAAADVSGIGLYDAVLKTQAVENTLVGLVHFIIGGQSSRLIGVKTVGVFH